MENKRRIIAVSNFDDPTVSDSLVAVIDDKVSEKEIDIMVNALNATASTYSDWFYRKVGPGYKLYDSASLYE